MTSSSPIQKQLRSRGTLTLFMLCLFPTAVFYVTNLFSLDGLDRDVVKMNAYKAELLAAQEKLKAEKSSE